MLILNSSVATRTQSKEDRYMKPEEIGHRLKALRGDKTLWDISKATGIQMPLLSLYENGKRVPSDTNKIILAQYYGQTVQEIFFD